MLRFNFSRWLSSQAVCGTTKSFRDRRKYIHVGSGENILFSTVPARLRRAAHCRYIAPTDRSKECRTGLCELGTNFQRRLGWVGFFRTVKNRSFRRSLQGWIHGGPEKSESTETLQAPALTHLGLFAP